MDSFNSIAKLLSIDTTTDAPTNEETGGGGGSGSYCVVFAKNDTPVDEEGGGGGGSGSYCVVAWGNSRDQLSYGYNLSVGRRCRLHIRLQFH